MSDSSERAVRNAKTPVKFSTYNEGDCDNEPHAAVLPPHGIANTLCLVAQAPTRRMSWRCRVKGGL